MENKNQSALRGGNITHHKGRNFKKLWNDSSDTEIYFSFYFSNSFVNLKTVALRGGKVKNNLLCEAEKRSLSLCLCGEIFLIIP